MPCWRLFLETYADTGHFSPTRYARLSMSLKDPVFLGLLGAYYVTLKANFRVSSKVSPDRSHLEIGRRPSASPTQGSFWRTSTACGRGPCGGPLVCLRRGVDQQPREQTYQPDPVAPCPCMMLLMACWRVIRRPHVWRLETRLPTTLQKRRRTGTPPFSRRAFSPGRGGLNHRNLWGFVHRQVIGGVFNHVDLDQAAGPFQEGFAFGAQVNQVQVLPSLV